MSLVEDVTAAIAGAMGQQDAPRLSALRMLKAALMNKSVEKNRDLDDAESLQVVNALGLRVRKEVFLPAKPDARGT